MVFARNMSRIGYADLDGRSGFKLAMKEADGRFYLYVAALWEPGLTILDVTDPTQPRQVRWIDGPPNTWTLQVQVAEDRMITNLERVPPGWGDSSSPGADGLTVWDLDDPENPKVLGTWVSGATGSHRNFYDGGRYVHAATTLPGFVGHVYGVIDIADPTNPTLVGKWWYPGQNAAAGEVFSTSDQAKNSGGRPAADLAIFLHGGPYKHGDRVYCPWARAGLVILDVSDVTQPELVSVLSVYPPLGSTVGVHTAVPLPDRNLVLINDEALNERRGDPANYAGVVDISDEQNPVLVSLFPVPEAPPGAPADFFMRGGRFGPHNQHQPQGQSWLGGVDDHVFLTYFNAGVQVFDIADPLSPRVAGYWIPDDPVSRRGPQPSTLVAQVEDVLVDRRGYVYVSEKNSGISVLMFDPGSTPTLGPD
jgi:hypothetical protein